MGDRSSDQAIYFIPATETKHISEVRREELAKSCDESEVATRVHGTPMLGSGPIFPVSLLPGLTRWFDKSEIPRWAKHVVGIDFGFAHPFAAVWLAWTPDTQQFWVIDCFKMTRASAADHVHRIHLMTDGLRIKLFTRTMAGPTTRAAGFSSFSSTRRPARMWPASTLPTIPVASPRAVDSGNLNSNAGRENNLQ